MQTTKLLIAAITAISLTACATSKQSMPATYSLQPSYKTQRIYWEEVKVWKEGGKLKLKSTTLAKMPIVIGNED